MRFWIKIIGIFFIFLALLYMYIYFVVSKNDNYLFNEIVKNTDIKDIDYINKNNYNYVVVTKNDIYVIDDDYEIIWQAECDSLNLKDYDIVYKRNKVMYEDNIINGDYLVYRYYDVSNMDFIYEVKLRR